MLARIFNASVWLPMQNLEQTASLLDQDGDGVFDDEDIDALVQSYIYTPTPSDNRIARWRHAHAPRVPRLPHLHTPRVAHGFSFK